jgi:hypothetical protein
MVSALLFDGQQKISEIFLLFASEHPAVPLFEAQQILHKTVAIVARGRV